MDSVLEAQEVIGRAVEECYPETEVGIDRVERVLTGASTDLGTQGCHPEVVAFMETVESLCRSQFPRTWKYAEQVLSITVPGDSYRDEASKMLRFTMGYEFFVPNNSDLPPTDDVHMDVMRAKAIKEIKDWIRDARREHRQPRAPSP